MRAIRRYHFAMPPLPLIAALIAAYLVIFQHF